jgi:hypothetical protein
VYARALDWAVNHSSDIDAWLVVTAEPLSFVTPVPFHAQGTVWTASKRFTNKQDICLRDAIEAATTGDTSAFTGINMQSANPTHIRTYIRTSPHVYLPTQPIHMDARTYVCSSSRLTTYAPPPHRMTPRHAHC